MILFGDLPLGAKFIEAHTAGNPYGRVFEKVMYPMNTINATYMVEMEGRAVQMFEYFDPNEEIEEIK
jgi:hypothetical protein